MYWEGDYFRRPYGLFLLLFAFWTTQNRYYKPIQRIFQVANSLISLTMLHRLVHTMCDMLFENGFANLIERGANGRNLCQYVIALAAFFHSRFRLLAWPATRASRLAMSSRDGSIV